MLPANLLPRANEIFKEMGGYESASASFTDDQIIDICLFNGYTAVLFPYYQAFSSDLDNGLDPYNLLDLDSIGYKPYTYYHILDKHYNSLYTSYPTIKEINGFNTTVFGASDLDLDFYSLTKEAELFYMVYREENSLSLCQLIVSHKIPRSVLDLNIARWEAMLKAQQEESIGNNELVIDLNNYENIVIYKLEGNLAQRYGEMEIVYSANSEELEINNQNSIYLSLDRPIWLALRSYAEYEEPALESLTGTPTSEALLSLGYVEVYSEGSYRSVYTKLLPDGYTAEVEAFGNIDATLSNYNTRKYKPLKLTNIVGDRPDSIKDYENYYFIKYRATEVELINSVGGPPQTTLSRLNRESFKLQTLLSYE